MQLATYVDWAVEDLLGSDLTHLSHPSDYDTVWAARLTHPDGSLVYPDLLQTLIGRQREDGSWGGAAPNVYDRLISTLAVVTLLARHGDRQEDRRAVRAGQRYVWHHMGNLQHMDDATVGFEMIVPTLLRDAHDLGLQLPYGFLSRMEAERRAKLALLPMDRLFASRTTALFSLEAFDRESVDVGSVSRLLSEDGSVAGSPSATACFLAHAPEWREDFPESARYIESLVRRYGSGLPAVAPYDLFATSWVLHNLHHGNLAGGREEALRPHLDLLKRCWDPEGGVGASDNAIPDSDDTAMLLLALSRAGYEVDGSVLLRYEREGCFAVFGHERHPSISANLHILEALETLPEGARARARDKILDYVMNARKHGALWHDKWHASAYYPTSQAVLALTPHLPRELRGSVDWLLFMQRPDGGWGQYGTTAEETALALISLLHYHRNVEDLPHDAMHRAAAYLLDRENPFRMETPELWIAKTLYAPTYIIRSSVLAALNLYHETLAR